MHRLYIFMLFCCGTKVSADCVTQRPFLRYHRIRSCYRSSASAIAWKSVTDLKACMRFVRERNGLAFNFSPPEATQGTNIYVRNCQVLGCPELTNISSLIPDLVFDYYSAYGNLNTTENATCIRSVGIFNVLKQKRNYSGAAAACQEMGADLADITSETRTNSLSELISSLSDWYKAAYVGLDDIEVEGSFQTPLGLDLACTKFRAWAPGHPRPKRKWEDCVILDSSRVWRAINCKVKLGSVCEFYPEPPENQEFEIKDVGNCTEIKNKREKKKCMADKELYELYKNASRFDQCALLNGFDY